MYCDLVPSMWMTAGEAARALGVKPETLYAYVSRGLIASEREPGDRRSRYARADVERLAKRQRSGGRAGSLEVIVETELTLLEPDGRLTYRGWDVEEAIEDATFETVATWLWTGRRADVEFAAAPELVRATQRVAKALGSVTPTDRIRAALAAIRGEDPLRHDRRPEAVAATARSIIVCAIDAMGPGPSEGSVAARLWPRLTAQRATAKDVALLDATLILLADHELAASTLAARIAASTWADPYLVVLTGLAVLGGPLHGSASHESRLLLRDVRDGGLTAAEAIGNRLASRELIPGFGHRVYRTRDPRADALLAKLLARRSTPSSRAADAILETTQQRELPFPNIDFSLALFAETFDMVDGAGELIFAIARIAGWLAHAIEEYPHRLRFRPRAAYIGPTASHPIQEPITRRAP
jgi:citrate synthase